MCRVREIGVWGRLCACVCDSAEAGRAEKEEGKLEREGERERERGRERALGCVTGLLL